MIRVVLESPFGSRTNGSRASPEEVVRNVEYLHRAMRDCFNRGEAPYASHGIYPAILNDSNPKQRRAGMEAGFAWGRVANRAVVYTDYGITPGMQNGIDRYSDRQFFSIEYRKIGKNADTRPPPTPIPSAGKDRW